MSLRMGSQHQPERSDQEEQNWIKTNEGQIRNWTKSGRHPVGAIDEFGKGHICKYVMTCH